MSKGEVYSLRIFVVFVVCALLFVFKMQIFSEEKEIKGIQVYPLVIKTIPINESKNFPCVTGKILNMSFPVCTYTSAEDIYVSTWFHRGIYWEANYVTAILKFMSKYSAGNKESLALVDIGTNIGAFSLAAAHAGYRVLSAEPSRETYKRLAKSVSMGNIEHRMTIFPYIISNNRELLSMNIDNANKGGNFAEHNANSTKKGSSYSVQAILLDDLINFIPNKKAVMKIDAQGSETRILHPSSSTKFFTEIDVPLILLEWVYYHVASQYPHKNTVLLTEMLQHLKNMTFEPYTFTGQPISNPRTYTEPDIIFKKRGYDFKI